MPCRGWSPAAPRSPLAVPRTRTSSSPAPRIARTQCRSQPCCTRRSRGCAPVGRSPCTSSMQGCRRPIASDLPSSLRATERPSTGTACGDELRSASCVGPDDEHDVSPAAAPAATAGGGDESDLARLRPPRHDRSRPSLGDRSRWVPSACRSRLRRSARVLPVRDPPLARARPLSRRPVLQRRRHARRRRPLAEGRHRRPGRRLFPASP